MELKLINDAIVQLVDKGGNVVFSFELKRLDEYWYGKAEDYEYLHVTRSGKSLEYVIIVMTTASGQGGIVAVVDTANGEIIHYHDGEYALFAEIHEEYVITIRRVQYWGVKPYKCVDAVRFGTKENISGERQVKVDDSIGDDFTYRISDGAIQFKDSSDKIFIIDVADLLSE